MPSDVIHRVVLDKLDVSHNEYELYGRLDISDLYILP